MTGGELDILAAMDEDEMSSWAAVEEETSTDRLASEGLESEPEEIAAEGAASKALVCPRSDRN